MPHLAAHAELFVEPLMCGPCLLREAAGGRLCPRHRRLDSRQETIRPEMRRGIEARALLEGERDRGELELGLAIGEAAAQVRAARLMRGEIRGHQWSSVVMIARREALA